MRSTKLVATLVAAFVSTVLVLTAVPAEAAKPPHRITNFNVVVKDYDEHIFVARGNAVTAKGQRIYIQSSPWGSTTYRTVTSRLSRDSDGLFRFRVRSKCGAKWRIVIRADKQQRTTTRFQYWPDRPTLTKYFGRYYC